MHQKFKRGVLYITEEYQTAIIIAKSKPLPSSVREENRKNDVKNPKRYAFEVYHKHTGFLYRTRIKNFKEAQKYARKLDLRFNKTYKVIKTTIFETEARRKARDKKNRDAKRKLNVQSRSS